MTLSHPPQTREQLIHMIGSTWPAMHLMRRWSQQYDNAMYPIFARENESTLRQLLALRHAPKFRRKTT